MANSRKSPRPNKPDAVTGVFERALGEILARVSVCAPEVAHAQAKSSSDIASGIASGVASGLALGIALSGGLDSSVLLVLAAACARKHGLRLHAFHIHHGLSPNADAWTTHCEQLCASLDVPLHVRKVTVEPDGRGIEDAARIARYAALGELARANATDVLLTAHHQDDQAETVLLQLLRGAGLPGLSGMPFLQRRVDLLGCEVALARPLIEVRRVDLERFAAAMRLAHAEDESNADARYLRNALRHRIAPAMEAFFPGFAQRVARSANHAQAAQRLLDDLACIDLQKCRGISEGSLSMAALKGLSGERCDNLLRYWLISQQVVAPSAARLDEIRRQMMDSAADQHPAFEFGAVTLRRIAGKLELQPTFGKPPGARVTLIWQDQDILDVPQWRGRLRFICVEEGGVPDALLRGAPLCIRPRQGQERLRVQAGRPSRSLKNLYQEAAIPAWRRPWLPMLYLDDVLLMVAGVGIDVRYCETGPGILPVWESQDQAEATDLIAPF